MPFKVGFVYGCIPQVFVRSRGEHDPPIIELYVRTWHLRLLLVGCAHGSFGEALVSAGRCGLFALLPPLAPPRRTSALMNGAKTLGRGSLLNSSVLVFFLLIALRMSVHPKMQGSGRSLNGQHDDFICAKSAVTSFLLILTLQTSLNVSARVWVS